MNNNESIDKINIIRNWLIELLNESEDEKSE